RPALQTFNGASVMRCLPEELGRALVQASAELNSTLFMKLFAGFNILLHELSGARDLVVGIPVARRTRRELECVIGCFINTLALRTRIGEDASFATVLADTRATVLGAFAHQDAPFERVVEALAPRRDASHAPVFQVLFNHLHVDDPGLATENPAVEREVLVDPETKFDMTLYVRERRERIEVRAVYNADLFDADRIERLLERYEQVLETCVGEPRRALCEWLRPGSAGAALTSAATPGAELPESVGAAPETLVAMLALWCEVLKLDRVGAEQDFFALGGHSLLAAQLVARVGERFGVAVPLRTVFAHPTAVALAAWVDGALTDGHAPGLPPIRPVPGGVRELSLDQERLWALHRAGVDGHYYNVPRAVRLSGRLDLDALHGALRAVVRHHTALRTVFEDGPDGPRTRVREDQDIELEVLDGADATAAIEREAGHRFDLGDRLPVRAALVRHAPDDSTLIVTAHHIAADCWSLGLPFQAIVARDEPWYPGIFFADLLAVYDALSRRQPVPLAPPPITFTDFARWQKARLHGGDFAQHAAFWRDHLAGAPRTIELPTDGPRRARHTLAGARVEFPFPADLAGRLDRLRRDHRTTLFVPLLAAFGLAMRDWSGQDDLVVGTPVANRMQPQTRHLVGPVGNSVALRLRVGDEPTPAALIARLREVVPQVFAHQEYPFAQLVRDLDASGARPPLFQVRFVLQQAPDTLPNLPHLAMAPVKIDRGVSKYDLSLIVAAQGPRLRAWCEFNTDLFRPATIDAFVQSYVGTLQAMVGARDHAG
ncbi:MAG: condensation domain-containing protein, partial [Candidatus Binatia bacterium]